MSVVYPYAYIAKCAIMRFVVMNPLMYSNPVFLERSFYFLSKYTRWKFFLLLMRHFTKLRKLSSCYFFETVEVVANGGEGTEIVGVVANDGKATEIVDVVPDDGEATEIICVVADDNEATKIVYVVACCC